MKELESTKTDLTDKQMNALSSSVNLEHQREFLRILRTAKLGLITKQGFSKCYNLEIKKLVLELTDKAKVSKYNFAIDPMFLADTSIDANMREHIVKIVNTFVKKYEQNKRQVDRCLKDSQQLENIVRNVENSEMEEIQSDSLHLSKKYELKNIMNQKQLILRRIKQQAKNLKETLGQLDDNVQKLKEEEGRKKIKILETKNIWKDTKVTIEQFEKEISLLEKQSNWKNQKVKLVTESCIIQDSIKLFHSKIHDQKKRTIKLQREIDEAKMRLKKLRR